MSEPFDPAAVREMLKSVMQTIHRIGPSGELIPMTSYTVDEQQFVKMPWLLIAACAEVERLRAIADAATAETEAEEQAQKGGALEAVYLARDARRKAVKGGKQ